MKFSWTIAIILVILCITAVVVVVIGTDTYKPAVPGEKNPGLMTNQTPGNERNNNPPPEEAIHSCSGKTIGSDCQFEMNEGVLQGVCDDKPGILACAPGRDQNSGQKTEGKPERQNNNTQSGQISTSFDSCINHTTDNPECKECCDCLTSADGMARTKCRDTCATHDFSKNSELIPVSAPSVSGPNGNYTECVEKGSAGECKSCCEGSLGLQCGDFRHCRTACNNKFGDTKTSPENGKS